MDARVERFFGECNDMRYWLKADKVNLPSLTDQDVMDHAFADQDLRVCNGYLHELRSRDRSRAPGGTSSYADLRQLRQLKPGGAEPDITGRTVCAGLKPPFHSRGVRVQIPSRALMKVDEFVDQWLESQRGNLRASTHHSCTVDAKRLRPFREPST